jgi:hypothetical protein
MPEASLVTYQDMTVGRVFSPHKFVVTQEMISAYRRIFSPPSDSPLTGILFVHARKSYVSDGNVPSGGVMAELRMVFHRPFEYGTPMQFQAVVVDRNEKRGKGWVLFESKLTSESEHVATVNILGVWPL